MGGLCRWPPNTFWMEKWTTMVDKSTLNLTVILHGFTQTHCLIVPKYTDNALSTLNIGLGKMGDHATIATKQVH